MYSHLSDAWNSERISLDTNQTELSLNTLDPLIVSLCDGSWKHVRECKTCQSKLKKLIDLDVEDRLDRLLLEKKLAARVNDKDFPWKDAAMIGLGTAVVVLLFLLVLKK